MHQADGQEAAAMMQVGRAMNLARHFAERPEVAEAHTVAAFRVRGFGTVFHSILSKPTQEHSMQKRIFTDRERAEFSLTRVFHKIQADDLRGTYEAELLQDVAMRENRLWDRTSPTIPWELLGRRDMTAAGVSGSQYLVSTQSASPVDILRPLSVVANAGATIIANQRANLTIPEVGTVTTSQWLTSEADPLTAAQPAVGSLSFSPKIAGSVINYNRQLDLQNPALEQFLRLHLVRTAAAALDEAALQGSGVSGEPQGLTNTPDVTAQSGTALAWTGILAMQKACAAANGAPTAWIAGTTTQEVLQGREKFTGAGPIWNDNGIAGIPALATTSAPADSLFCGPWDRLVIALWGSGPMITINPFASFNTGGLAMRVLLTCDVGFLSRSAFARSTSIT